MFTTYWGVAKGDEILFKGTHTECWKWLILEFANDTVADLVRSNVRIKRVG